MNRFICYEEGCELPHCKRCGHHYDIACAEGKAICDGCQIQDVCAETEAITKAFDGNYEEAARFMGW